MHIARIALLGAILLVSHGCTCGGSGEIEGDGGGEDASNDAGRDATRGGTDARVDAPSRDAAPHDAARDAGDAGPSDAGPDADAEIEGGGDCPVVGEGNRCTSSLGAGTCCGGVCVDVASDSASCGACDVHCPTGTTCQFGVCARSTGDVVVGCGAGCPAGTVCSTDAYGSWCLPAGCGAAHEDDACSLSDAGIGACCGSSCADPTSDPDNCGVCGGKCGKGAVCVAGICCTSGCGSFADCQSGACSVPCPAGTAPYGRACLPTTCPAEAQGQLDCVTGSGDLGTCCAGKCVDVLGDAANCGECGQACPAGVACNLGFCPIVTCAGAATNTQCLEGDGGIGSCCGDACVDILSDETACAGCGLECPAGGSCNEESCYLPDGGFFSCSGAAGCPAGSACSSQDYCSPLACKGVADGEGCAFGPNLGGTCCGGECVDPGTDPENCGQCGFGSATGRCVVGRAFPPPADAGVCPPCTAEQACLIQGFNVSNGPYCYVPSCDFPGGDLCLLSGGGPGACCPGPKGRSCVDLDRDKANCGACGAACPDGQTCTNGACSGDLPACAGLVGGFCDLDAGLAHVCCPGGGCTDTKTDPANCGACGNACDGGTCADGRCK